MGSRALRLHRRDEERGPCCSRKKSVVREYTEVILRLRADHHLPRTFVAFQQSEIPSGSMEDTILIGDYILVNRMIYAPARSALERVLLPRREIRRGDIVVFKNPKEPERDFIKRVTGLPGDTLEVRDGVLWINGRALDEPYLNPLYRPADPHDPFGPVTVEPGNYFMMGDHRNNSTDSRVWGPVPRELVKGRAFLILFSTGAPGQGGQPAEKVTLISLVQKLYNLVFHSRWDRAFRTIS